MFGRYVSIADKHKGARNKHIQLRGNKAVSFLFRLVGPLVAAMRFKDRTALSSVTTSEISSL